MFYVSILKEAYDKIISEAEASKDEIIGILVGRIEKHTLVIDRAVSGDMESEATFAKLSPDTLAEITDKLMKGEIEGKILGWYHSHPGFGVFMSGTDISTQLSLQRFSSKVTAAIVDPDDGEVGFFTLDGSGRPLRLAEDQVHIYEEEDDAVPKGFSKPPKEPEPEMPYGFGPNGAHPGNGPNNGQNSRTILLVSVVSMVVLAAGLGALLISGPPSDNHIKYPSVTVVIGGNLRSGLGNVTLVNGIVRLDATVDDMNAGVNQTGVVFEIRNNYDIPWTRLGNIHKDERDIYPWILDTSVYRDGEYLVKAKFSDRYGKVWVSDEVMFIIDNVEDPPIVTIFRPDEGDVLNSSIEVVADVIDPENNQRAIEFYINGSSMNATFLNRTGSYGNRFFSAYWDITALANGTYTITAVSTDRNLYQGHDEVRVTVINQGNQTNSTG
jgi:proteasome lid subunit RPN8/RPN11